jgi:cob(I)alamin adenosyltransferase
MKIYTKTGDKGNTSLYSGKRVKKSSFRIEAFGSVDELNAVLGCVRSLSPSSSIDEILNHIQYQLFVLGADLATPEFKKSKKVQRISEQDIKSLENTIDELEKLLLPLQSFILPGGSPVAAQLHLARTVCRRAERCVDTLCRKEKCGTQPLIFLNRLSDLLFVLARYANNTQGVKEVAWHGGSKK